MDDLDVGTATWTGSNLRPTAGAARCTIGQRAGHLHLTVTTIEGIVHAADLPAADVALLERLVTDHDRCLSSGWSLDPFTVWSDATEPFLAAVHDLVSRPIVAAVESHALVELAITSPAAVRLPIETAHRPGEPALIDLVAIHRTAAGCPGGSSRPHHRRSFRTVVAGHLVPDLPSLPLEHALVAGAGSSSSPGRDEPLLHVAGHDPVIPSGRCRPSDRAHAVLSGCRSLTTRLAAGVASATATLWPVDDAAMPSLIGAMAVRIAVGVGPAEALRQSQLLHRHLPPRTWAALVHVGQPI